ncbi:hypothetical protein [Gordonia sp. (in: high G+C Gram-positive bacteria)]|uniref:hypothetical protein n=1 Tax=Gordonia sp. (in: high G+C Gram-positive bacteria) TaxID=84139 RepID=UPI0016A6BE00|nr:hypothetical protein [Gordonia sp. (in: high G+C Gram-positive bacteria)]NLG47530.1 hypothetical protein [Gordonia sp. (in: high G+C Gram-positive bacteria)]
MAHIDLYKVFGLDRRTHPDDVWRTLTDRLQGADIAARHQIETARAILSDPTLRAQYDARLADLSAPPLDPAALDRMVASHVQATPEATLAPASASSGVPVPVLATVAVLLVIAVGVFAAVMLRDGGEDQPANAAASTASSEQPTAPAQPPHQQPEPTPESGPTAPVDGAYVDAGGPRPPGAIPLPTYVSRYGKVSSAHLLTPTGGIGCDFQEAGSGGKQGQCGVRKFNRASSPLGTEKVGGSTKGKWLFQLVGDRVGQPVATTGTTGWMNQPANDGYQVPRVEYGKQYYFQDWVVASEENGLTLWNTKTGSGVFLSNERVETFEGPGRSAPTTGTSGEGIVLGSVQSNGRGYGNAQPSAIDLGGASSTSIMTGISWTDWGSDRATGTGVGTYQPPDKSGIYKESNTPGIVAAFAPGMCSGKRAYTKIVYYFPSKGQGFDAANAIDICTAR